MLKKICCFFAFAMSFVLSTHLIAGLQPNQNPQGGVSSRGLQWYTDYNQAVQAAQQQQKPIILFFTGSDWCGWCKKIDQEVFNSPDFAAAVGNKFIFVDVDFPMNKALPSEQTQQNAMLKQKYNITGYPTVVVLDPNLNVLEVGGYRPGGGKEYANYLMQFMGNAQSHPRQ